MRLLTCLYTFRHSPTSYGGMHNPNQPYLRSSVAAAELSDDSDDGRTFVSELGPVPMWINGAVADVD